MFGVRSATHLLSSEAAKGPVVLDMQNSVTQLLAQLESHKHFVA